MDCTRKSGTVQTNYPKACIQYKVVDLILYELVLLILIRSKRWWYIGQHGCLPSSRSRLDPRTSQCFNLYANYTKVKSIKILSISILFMFYYTYNINSFFLCEIFLYFTPFIECYRKCIAAR